jgi:hypothetical protein
MQLLIAARTPGATYTWYDPVNRESHTRRLGGTWLSWLRILVPFFMSFLINAIGYNLLLLSIPVQVSATSTIKGIAGRAKGILWLVDL